VTNHVPAAGLLTLAVSLFPIIDFRISNAI
jgi:hypothetical protein